MHDYERDKLEKLLLEVDAQIAREMVVREGAKLPLVIAGGSSLMLAGLTSRTVTRDIDVLYADPALKPVLAQYPRFNDQIRVYEHCLPQGFDKRLRLIKLPTNVVEYLRPSAEDIVVMKLYSWRKTDQVDVLCESMLEALDLQLLDGMIRVEARDSALTKQAYERMLRTYEREFLPKATKTLKRLARRK